MGRGQRRRAWLPYRQTFPHEFSLHFQTQPRPGSRSVGLSKVYCITVSRCGICSRFPMPPSRILRWIPRWGSVLFLNPGRMTLQWTWMVGPWKNIPVFRLPRLLTWTVESSYPKIPLGRKFNQTSKLRTFTSLSGFCKLSMFPQTFYIPNWFIIQYRHTTTSVKRKHHILSGKPDNFAFGRHTGVSQLIF